MADNLRRSLTPVALVVGFLVALAVLPASAAWVWLVLVAASFLLPPLLPLAPGILLRRKDVTKRSQAQSLASDLAQGLTLGTLNLVFLSHQAAMMVDAIARTLWRMVVTHKHMLEWTTAAAARHQAKGTVKRFVRVMALGYVAPIAALAITVPRGLGLIAVCRHPRRPVAQCPDRRPARQPSLRAGGGGRDRRRAGLPPGDRPPHLELLRHVRHCRGESPPTGQLPGGSAPGGRPPDVPDQHRPLSPGDGQRAGLRVDRARGHRRPPRGHPAHGHGPRSPPGPPVQLVRHPHRGAPASAATCRAWTAETSRDTCWRWPTRARNGPRTPIWARTAGRGIADGVALIRQSLADVDPQTISAVDRSAISERLAAVDSALAGGEAAGDIAQRLAAAGTALARLADVAPDQPEVSAWITQTRRSVDSLLRDSTLTTEELTAIAARLTWVADQARREFDAMDFTFLLDPRRELLSVGLQADLGTLDKDCYDLLASECRLASFVAIAKGDIPTRHWTRLGRTVTAAGGGAALLSWSGSMFEYLMPPLVMRTPSTSLLSSTSRRIVRHQIEYGTSHGVPWGISESGYNARDPELNYQYSPFGAPGLGHRPRPGRQPGHRPVRDRPGGHGHAS